MRRTGFNENWICRRGSGSALADLFGPGSGEGVPVTLPDDAVIRTKRKDDPFGSGTGFYAGENIHYTKSFCLPEEDRGKDVWIEFEGIYQNAFLYINQSYVGKCPYGYGNYYFDITKYLEQEMENTVKVVVKNGVPSGRWYTGGGIYRNVSLLTGGPLHIACRGAKVTTLYTEEELAALRVETPVENTGRETGNIIIHTEILDEKERVVSEAETPLTVFGGEKKTIRQRVTVTSPHLWDPDSPDLYRCRIRLMENGTEMDKWEEHFGIRTLRLDPQKGLRINGKPVKLRGGCIHHDHGIIGAAEFEHAEERRIRKLKEAGFNAIRMSHYPAAKALLRVCDRMGMLVMDEFTDVWTTTKMDFDYGMSFDTFWERDVENMVHKDYNHPSVILYSIGNEIPETGNQIDCAWGKKIADKIRALDDSRYTVNSVNFLLSSMSHMDEIMRDTEVKGEKGAKEINTLMADLGNLTDLLVNHEITTQATAEAFGQVDIAGYNYASARYEADIRRFPDRIIVGSETYAPMGAYNWSLVKKYPQILGDFVWTAWDYIGEAGIGQITYGKKNGGFYGSYPWKTAYAGVLDLIGDRRPVSYLREITWGLRDEPYISVQPPGHYGEKQNIGPWTWTDSVRSWTWDGYEGKPVIVEVFADADEVELFINEKSVGRKQLTEKDGFAVKFDTVYEPGTVRAAAYRNGKMKEDILHTAKGENCIVLTCSKTKIKGSDIAFLEISITDGEGILNPGSSKEVRVSVEGTGSLYGLGSADPKSEEDYWQDRCRVFGGRALAAVRGRSESGQITVSVSADGCETKTVSLETS